MKSKRIIVALTGASGIQYGIEVLQALVESRIETHVILSEWAEYVLQDEVGIDVSKIKEIAFRVYDSKEMDAPLSSSSTLIDGMVVIPATVKTVSNIANANTENLISRAADIMLKMRRPLIIGIRETPLSPPCIHNLNKLATYGAIILPLSPGFYHKPQNIQDLFNFITGKVLDCLNIPNEKYRRWKKSEQQVVK
ncbi:MAG: UbiX family flavin prenyltransferase [Candidatus Heimdallarchaeota archaeon]|nr:MAG: UbiX family flavin prenyltransferase [Candidatus Heimdallarchaeota archaeon]